MLNDWNSNCPVYLATGYTDLRKGIDGLAVMVQEQFKLNPFSDALFLFCGRRGDTPNGAQGSAIIFSLIETAKEAGLNPYKYLVYLLKAAPQLSLKNADWAEKILPQYAPDSCKAN